MAADLLASDPSPASSGSKHSQQSPPVACRQPPMQRCRPCGGSKGGGGGEFRGGGGVLGVW
jgi:hypothetical protein